jgi:3-hydroxyisobutyrate dehydrogenase-like beta-hydroxyacid dehydrogenase
MEVLVKAGFIGLGRMGQAMARRVLAGGHDLILYNRTPGKTSELATLGAGVAKSIADAARHGGIVLTMLSDDAALTEVANAPGGLIETLPKGGIHVAMGTHQISTIQQLAEAHSRAGQILVAAPVLGRPEAVEARRLGIIAAGPHDAIARIQPLFDAIGRRTFQAGADQSAASLMKVTSWHAQSKP